MVLLFGFPESPFAQPKNVFFGHLVTALVGVIFVSLIPFPIYINIALAVGVGIFLMITSLVDSFQFCSIDQKRQWMATFGHVLCFILETTNCRI